MFKKAITILLILVTSFKIISMEDFNETISHYESQPLEIKEKILREYFKSCIENIALPMGKSSLIQFQAQLSSCIKNARLINHITNDLVVSLKYYVISLLIRKLAALTQDQKIDCLSLFLEQKSMPLAVIALLSFLDINQMDEITLHQYIRPHFENLYESFKAGNISASSDTEFLLNVKNTTKKKLKLLLDIQKNIEDASLFDISNWFKLTLQKCYKGFLKILLKNYNNIEYILPDSLKCTLPSSLIIEAAMGNMDKINQLPNEMKCIGYYGLTLPHWTIIGNPTNLKDVLDILITDQELKILPLANLQYILKLAISWSDDKIVEYLLSRFQNNLPFDLFMTLINQKYSSKFNWGIFNEVNVPLIHAIKNTNNKHCENIILTLINYGADLSCIKWMGSYRQDKSLLVHELMTNGASINKVIEELHMIKETNIDQPYTLENIFAACEQVKISEVNLCSTNAMPMSEKKTIKKTKTDKKRTAQFKSKIKKYAKIGFDISMLAMSAYASYRFIKSNMAKDAAKFAIASLISYLNNRPKPILLELLYPKNNS